MTIRELLNAIEALENNPNNYVGGLDGRMSGAALKVSVQKKIASLQKKLDAALGDDEGDD
jgi:hypothetical protein